MLKTAPPRFDPVHLVRQSEAKLRSASRRNGSVDNLVYQARIPLQEFERVSALLHSDGVEFEETDSVVKGSGVKGAVAKEGQATIHSDSVNQHKDAGSAVTDAIAESVTAEFSLSTWAREGIEELESDPLKDGPLVVAKGRLSSQLTLQCQRCLSPFQHLVDEPFKLVFASGEKVASAMPDDIDPVLLDEEGSITLVNMLEDELLLHVPDFARHPQEEDCTFDSLPYLQLKADADDAAKGTGQGGVEGKQNPFAVLKDLKIDKP